MFDDTKEVGANTAEIHTVGNISSTSAPPGDLLTVRGYPWPR